MEAQEKIMMLNMLEQETNQIKERLGVIDEQIQEMITIKECLQEIDKKSKEGKGNKDGDKEILANLGKGILIKTELKEDKTYINVGAGLVVKRTIPETLEIVDEQLENLEQGKEEFFQRILAIKQESDRLIGEIQSVRDDQEGEQNRVKKKGYKKSKKSKSKK